MDIESDDSERWEDFFGSSTDLTPSLLGIYDSLTTVLDSTSVGNVLPRKKNTGTSDYGNHGCSQNLESNRPSAESYLSKLQSYAKRTESADADELSQTSRTPSNSGSCNSSIKGSLESVASTSSHSNKHRTNIRILSPNVQRIIIHSDAEAVDAVDIEAFLGTPSKGTDAAQRQNKKTNSVPSNPHKIKFSHLPLSKTTGKLTQTGTDLVDTFNTELSEDCHRNDVKLQNPRKPSVPLTFPIQAMIDDDRTPTNATAFTFDKSNCEQLQNRRKLKSKNNCTDNCANDESILDEIITKMSLECAEAPETINLEVVSEKLNDVTIAAGTPPVISEDKRAVDAVNNTLISKYVAHNTPNRPLTYARSKSLAARDFALKNIEVKKTISTSHSMLLANAELDENQISAESLDRLSDIKSKFSPKETRKVSGLTLPDIAKLKHRPLSSSSICSTSSSSSSSSGAEHMASKMNTSYLASVESLADQSENELTEIHSGMSVFERACMEIVDSERNYVNDLGEVIRGYLSDWKERACLRQDDLQVLFSNIEDVYRFNQYLLKHLSASILDPVKIAKCFIDLKEGFDVYTTYCTSYPEAISLLTKLLQATHTNALLASTQRMLHHTLPLGSYLLKPVQRILKYHLLLDNLRKHCDIKEVMQAYEIMRQVARNIDQVKRKLEQQTRVKELSGILDGWLGPELTVLGELRLEGVLMENNKPRKVLLFATMLIIAKAKEDSRLQFKSYIHQNNLMLSEHLAGEPTSFYVIPYDEPRHQIKLTAKNRDQKRLWTQHIKSVILEKFDNIPLRAKELVYQLGDEEDRSTDKSPWKWGLNSTSTPTYLERRNQFRRSEMRSRSKVKRKTISNTTPIESFNEATSKEANNFVKSISKSAESINDKPRTSLDAGGSELQRLREGACDKIKCVLEQKCVCHGFKDDSNTRDDCKTTRQSYKTFRFGGKPLKERSKSVPRICMETDNVEKVTSETNKVKSSKCDEGFVTNSKTLPKRMTSSMKRQKAKAKETSTFYMALSEFEDSSNTVLKITESSENILNNSKDGKFDGSKDDGRLPDIIQKTDEFSIAQSAPQTLAITPYENVKQDAQIVVDLLKNSKEFDKVYSKMQKKRSLDKNVHHPKITESKLSINQTEVPPRPPSRSPPPLDSEIECLEFKSLSATTQEEPIYETLLRNVHVPYKFSPVLGRSKSMQYNKYREQKSHAPRPESDYVTLVYTNDGVLKHIEDNEVQRPPSKESDLNTTASSSSSTVTLKRDSLNSEICTEHNVADFPQQMSASFHGTSEFNAVRPFTAKSILKRLWSHSTLAVEESSSATLCSPITSQERRGSDGFEKERHSILHLQGSETIGERIAHVDYADPRQLFTINKQDDSKQLQRDSVFSLTSSSDSVWDSKHAKAKSSPQQTSFDYEDCVEACLENGFRDSAVYSDDNDKRIEKHRSLPLRTSMNPPLKPKPTHIPPSPLAKSPLKRSTSVNEQPPTTLSYRAPTVIMCPPDLSPSSSRSWVLQQIDNFSK